MRVSDPPIPRHIEVSQPPRVRTAAVTSGHYGEENHSHERDGSSKHPRPVSWNGVMKVVHPHKPQVSPIPEETLETEAVKGEADRRSDDCTLATQGDR